MKKFLPVLFGILFLTPSLNLNALSLTPNTGVFDTNSNLELELTAKPPEGDFNAVSVRLKIEGGEFVDFTPETGTDWIGLTKDCNDNTEFFTTDSICLSLAKSSNLLTDELIGTVQVKATSDTVKIVKIEGNTYSNGETSIEDRGDAAMFYSENSIDTTSTGVIDSQPENEQTTDNTIIIAGLVLGILILIVVVLMVLKKRRSNNVVLNSNPKAKIVAVVLGVSVLAIVTGVIGLNLSNSQAPESTDAATANYCEGSTYGMSYCKPGFRYVGGHCYAGAEIGHWCEPSPVTTTTSNPDCPSVGLKDGGDKCQNNTKIRCSKGQVIEVGECATTSTSSGTTTGTGSSTGTISVNCPSVGLNNEQEKCSGGSLIRCNNGAVIEVGDCPSTGTTADPVVKPTQDKPDTGSTGTSVTPDSATVTPVTSSGATGSATTGSTSTTTNNSGTVTSASKAICGQGCNVDSDCATSSFGFATKCVSNKCVNPACPTDTEPGTLCACKTQSAKCGDRCGVWSDGFQPLCGDGISTCSWVNGPTCGGSNQTYCIPTTLAANSGYTKRSCTSQSGYQYIVDSQGAILSGGTQAVQTKLKELCNPAPSQPENTAPRGYFDSVSCEFAQGWSCDSNDYSANIKVDLYVDGPVGQGTYVGSAIANQSRENAVGNLCNGNSARGYKIQIPSNLYNTGNRVFYAYPINVPEGVNSLVAGSPRTLNTNACGTNVTALPACGNMDSNGDGKLTVIDFAAFARVFNSACTNTGFTENSCGGRDTNKDGKIDITDFAAYARKSAKTSCS